MSRQLLANHPAVLLLTGALLREGSVKGTSMPGG